MEPKNLFKMYTDEMAKELVKAIKEKSFNPNVKGDGEFEVYATVEVEDRDGEIVMVDGIDYKNFMKNPVILFGHDYYSMPIGAATSIEVEKGKMIVKGVFAKTARGQEARKLYDDKFLKTVSIGFIPRERSEDRKTILKSELLELSFVPVPANAEALSLIKNFDEDQKDVLKKLLKSSNLFEEYKNLFDTEPPTVKEGQTEEQAAKDAANTEPEAKDTAKGEINNIMGTLEGDLNALVKNAIEQIKGVTGEAGTVEPKEEKSGRVLSGKNRKKVQAAIDVLTELLETTEEPKGNPDLLVKMSQNVDRIIEQVIVEAKKLQ